MGDLLKEWALLRTADAMTGYVVAVGVCCPHRIRITIAGEEREVTARSCVALDARDVGREVLLVFLAAQPDSPVVIGRLEGGGTAASESSVRMIEIDGESLVFEARREIVLRCGQASLTLTREGKVLIRGSYVLSRSTGVHSIKGASVQIN